MNLLMHLVIYEHERCFESSKKIRIFKTSRIPINHEMYEQVHAILKCL